MKLSTVVIKIMIRSFQFLFSTFFIFSLLSCSTTRNSIIGENDTTEKTVRVSGRIGLASGGLVENNKMSGITGVKEVDAISGATKTSVNFGIHTQINLKGHTIETGLDYIQFKQSVTYEMPSFSVNGKRDFQFHQLRLPLTYNLQFFKNAKNDPILILRPGISIGCTFSKSITSSGNIPDYKFTNWNVGPALGISIFPLQIKQNFRIGAYLDLFRGGQIYEDIYHKAEGVGGQSYWMFGIVLQPLTF